MQTRRILVLNGPNLNKLGTREPGVYGTGTLADLERTVVDYAHELGIQATCRQSNSEGELIDIIQESPGSFDGIVYNPGAHTHYSYALRDAVAAIDVPVVEVHLSDISARESFRHISVIAPVCIAQVKGMGVAGYCRAIDILCNRELADAPAIPDADLTTAFADEVAAVDLGFLSRERQAAVLAACGELDVSGMLVRDTSNIRWITALDGVFDEERAHALLVTDRGAALHTDSRYSNAVRTASARIGNGIQVNDDRISHADFAYDGLRETAGGAEDDAPDDAAAKLAIEDSITYAEFRKTADRFTAERLVPTTDLVLKLRAVKDAGEIARMRAAQAITDAAFSHIVAFMRPGMTEREVQLELESFMLHHGGEGLSFNSIVATGANGADPHAIAGSTRLEAGQCVVMDLGARAYGYCSDMTRTVFLGAPVGVMADAWSALRRANEEVEALLKPGVTGAEAHALAEKVLEEGGFGGKMGHGLGHGVGIDVHEFPVLNLRNPNPLEPGNVVTVEPGIYLPGQFGMRLEDCGVITSTGFDVFTQSTHEMVII